METSLRIKVSELDIYILESIKELFKKDSEITLTIQSATDFGLTKSESKKEYFARLKKAIKNIEEGNVVSFSEGELDELVMKQLKK